MSWIVLANLTCHLTSGTGPLVLVEGHMKKKNPKQLRNLCYDVILVSVLIEMNIVEFYQQIKTASYIRAQHI